MTRVSGSPRAITLLARTVDEVSRRLAFESAALGRAVDSTGPLLGLGTQPALAAQDLAAEARHLEASSLMLDEFVTALVAADDYGRAAPVGTVRSSWLVVTSELQLQLARNAARARANAVLLRGPEQPFVTAALSSGLLITPSRLRTLRELDNLATMPLSDFVAVRALEEDERPRYDWSSDGCSGPIPPGAHATCLRHDFLYRNARMIRDRWGTPREFALDIKEFADSNFRAELDASFSWLQRSAVPFLSEWLESAEAAVTVFGSIDEEWEGSRGFYSA